MVTNILKNISESLKKFLFQNLQEMIEENDILFLTPGELGHPDTPKLVVFLASFEENNYLRNTEPERQNNYKQYPPLILDIQYHLIPFAKEQEKEWMIIEKILQVFHDTKILQGDMIPKELLKSGNESIKITSFKIDPKSMERIQNSFLDKRYRLIASYTLSPIKIPSLRNQEFKEIKKRELDISKKEKSD